MNLAAFVEATQQREAALREHQDSPGEDDSSEEEPLEPPFSVQRLVDQSGPGYIGEAIKFTWAEFLDLYGIVERPMAQAGRGRKRRLQPVDRFFLFMLYLTSGFTFGVISRTTGLPKSCITRIVDFCLENLLGPFEALMPAHASDVQCDTAFGNFPEAFGIVDASPVFINRPTRHQLQYYSGKYKRHCVKVQVFIVPDGRCVHMSQVVRGSAHDKAIFDHSGLVEFLAERDGGGIDRSKVILGDLGYLGIARSGVRAILPHRRGKGRDLTDDQKQHNRVLSRDRILIENFFGRWKGLFGVCQGRYRGGLTRLGRIIRLTIMMTSWYIRRHPLRRLDEERVDESSEDGRGGRGEQVIGLDAKSSSDEE